LKQINIIEETVKRAQQGDTLAMKHLYDTYAKEMLSTAYRVTNNWNDAEDIIQEAFLDSFQKIAQLKAAKKYGSWLKRIVINKSIRKMKKQIHFRPILENDFEEDIEDNWYESIGMDKIKEAIQQLPEGCRQILSLYLFEELKHREIADLLDISPSTSKSQYRYALKLLAEELKKYKDERV